MHKNTNIKVILFLCAFFLSSVALFGLSSQGISYTTKNNKLDQTMPTIQFTTGIIPSYTLQQMIDNFNANFSSSYGFKVHYDGSFDIASPHDYFVTDFKAKSTFLDVIYMDVLWPAEFAHKGWLLPLDNSFNISYQAHFLQGQIQAATYNGHMYAVPWWHAGGMLYYRTDVLQYATQNGIINDPGAKPPTTWNELTSWTTAMMTNKTLTEKFNLTAGFVWQGESYEGLMCDFMEYLGATGTHSFLNADQSQPIFNTNAGVSQSLSYMKSLLNNSVSPQSVLNFTEESARSVWNAGNAIFMRNWPYAYVLSLHSLYLNGSLNSVSPNVQQFNVTSMPEANSSIINPDTSCLGGYQLGVSAYSKYPNQAKKFVMWLTNAQNQLQNFLGSGEMPTIKSLYNNLTLINSKQGYASKFLPIFEHTIPRPISPYYNQMSPIITSTIHSYLTGNLTLTNALNKLQKDVMKVINNQPFQSIITTKPTTITSVITTSTPGFEFCSILTLGLLSVYTLKKKKLH